ncbi:hypothetical protein BDV24DRAFT_168639 [Aspergillus arachidicola]|uniref:Uncharacterized protein n=1 Tax=Aspergillus arachidicola TaxID=656916 RepID=A0A5N6XSD4_9EURO|nr:hypothetical protein BDV24DRAFT_168639 [Aspergillus arachidicola]
MHGDRSIIGAQALYQQWSSVDSSLLLYYVGLCSVGKNRPEETLLLEHRDRILPERIVFPRSSLVVPDCSGTDYDGISENLFIYILHVHYKQDLLPDAREIQKFNATNPILAKSAIVNVENTTGVLCSQNFDYKKVYVEVDPTDPATQRGPGLKVTPIAPIAKLPTWYAEFMTNVTTHAQLWGEMFNMIMECAEGLLGNDETTVSVSSALFRLMQAKEEYNDYTAFLDTSELINTASAVYSSLLVQIYRFTLHGLAYYSTTDPNLRGEAVFRKQRLLLGLRNVVPRSPDTLDGSRRLVRLLEGTGHWTTSQFHISLQGHSFDTRVKPGEGQRHAFNIQVYRGPPVTDPMVSFQESTTRKKYWKHIGDNPWFRLSMLVAPILVALLVALLEVVQFVSDRSNGILDALNNSTTTLLSRYIPATMMLSVAIMYSAFEYSVTSLAPYRTLAPGNLIHDAAAVHQQDEYRIRHAAYMPSPRSWPGNRYRRCNDPGSIASAASLLAGSEIASSNMVPEGAEWMGRKEVEDERVFQGMRFRLGWMQRAEREEPTYRIEATS